MIFINYFNDFYILTNKYSHYTRISNFNILIMKQTQYLLLKNI